MNKIKYFFQFLIVIFVFFIFRLLGVKISSFIGGKIFQFIGPFFRSKKIIHLNIKRAFPNLEQKEINKITSNMWNNYGRVFAEYVFIKKFRNDKLSKNIIIEGKEILNDLKEKNVKAIFISGHFSNFELMAMQIEKIGIKIATIYRPLNNIFLNPLMEYLRKKYICKNQIKKGINGVRDAIKYIKRKHSIALMIDQRVSEGERVNFFDKPALTTTLPAQISTKYGIDIIPVYIERKKDNDFKLEFMNRISPANFVNKIKLTEELNKILEKMIERNPGQWIWTHNRWK